MGFKTVEDAQKVRFAADCADFRDGFSFRGQKSRPLGVFTFTSSHEVRKELLQKVPRELASGGDGY